ncbi:multicopper oxidase domain-containing protein [Longirhabdus pacifica]|uniref:multicopper oxidase domain-containing protein n=1 Tax=Longirhabdus pacifica TaxID=2305227 RepID=UPI001981A4C8|nr:multicopper oxidase domain-containing protein [Longirhabdus pacifica]
MVKRINPFDIPKFVTPLFIPPVFKPTVIKDDKGKVKSHDYKVSAEVFFQQVLPAPYPKTILLGYKGLIEDPKKYHRCQAHDDDKHASCDYTLKHHMRHEKHHKDDHCDPQYDDAHRDSHHDEEHDEGAWYYDTNHDNYHEPQTLHAPSHNHDHKDNCIFFQSSPGPSFEAIRGIPVNVQWINNITVPHPFPVDPTLHWANPNNIKQPVPPFKPFPPGYPKAQSPVPIVTHLHGGEVRPDFDGNPEAWFTSKEKKVGQAFVTTKYNYFNGQQPTTLWYHDHTLGITRLNVALGLAGFYLLRDPKNKIEPLLPCGEFEVPLVIQDRIFNEDGSYFFPADGVNPDVHPYWMPDFIGDAIIVNGNTWPNLDVKRKQYRFRILDGSNSRFYRLRLQDKFGHNIPFTQIGTDGGFLPEPVKLTEVLIGPAERIDILVDFSQFEPGTQLTLTNDAPAPFPNGPLPDPQTTGNIMQFTVVDSIPKKPKALPPKLNKIPKLTPNVPDRILTLNIVRDAATNNPLELLLNGQKWEDDTTELPIIGSTEEWQIVNLTAAVHPIHIHLIDHLLVNRQEVDVDRYNEVWMKMNGMPPIGQKPKPLAVEPFLLGAPIEPEPNERGWKDTIQVNPGQVTRIRLRFTPQEVDPALAKPGVNLFPFDPTVFPGYVWHCHILDHEDNDMMRPLKVLRKLPLKWHY